MVSESSFLIDSIYKGASESVRLQVIALWDRQADSMQLGVPLSVWQMSDKNTLGIFEAGISQPDEMERLQPIIAPTIGVITNIGEAHQENFISSTQKCLEKLTLFNDCEAIIYDGDDAFIANCHTDSGTPNCEL